MIRNLFLKMLNLSCMLNTQEEVGKYECGVHGRWLGLKRRIRNLHVDGIQVVVTDRISNTTIREIRAESSGRKRKG